MDPGRQQRTKVSTSVPALYRQQELFLMVPAPMGADDRVGYTLRGEADAVQQ